MSERHCVDELAFGVQADDAGAAAGFANMGQGGGHGES